MLDPTTLQASYEEGRGNADDAPSPPGLGADLVRFIETGRVGFERFEVDAAAFARHLGESSFVGPGDPPALPWEHASDVYLAHACGLGVGEALKVLLAEHTAGVDRLAAKLRPIGVSPEDFRQQLVERILSPAADGRPRIWTYSGRAPLTSWVRTVAARLVATRLRDDGGRREDPVDPDVLQDELPADAPHGEAERPDRYRDDVRSAFEAAFTRLSDEDRGLLRRYWIEGQTTDQLGARLGVHRTTVARWVDRARRRLLGLTKGHLAKKLGAQQQTVDGVMLDVRSQLELSVRRLLRTNAPGEPR